MGWVTYIVDQRAYRKAREREKAALIARAAYIRSVYYPPGYPGSLPAGVGMCSICLRTGDIGLLCDSPECDSFGASFLPVNNSFLFYEY